MAQTRDAEAAAKQTLDRFITEWNTADDANLREVLSFPFVSVAGGGGLVLDGIPYHGRTGNAGHVGHVVVDAGGRLCSCGGRGCVETLASGPNLVRWARDNGWQAAPYADAKTLAAAAVSTLEQSSGVGLSAAAHAWRKKG